jgi:dethiobiotin synthetase
MSSNRLFISGIGTDVGKTVASAILAKAFDAEYWKPVQAGDLDNSDCIKVQNLTELPANRFHPESYRLPYPMSPHASAEKAGIEIDISKIIVPNHQRKLIIEGAGGLMVPVNRKYLYIDLIPQFDAEVILVSRHYLGSINHTLLSIEALDKRGISIKGILFNGNENQGTESIILERSGIPFLGRISETTEVNPEFIASEARKIQFQ